MEKKPEDRATDANADGQAADKAGKNPAAIDPRAIKELGGPKGPEPTRYGDWEKGGRCSDF